MRNKYRLALAFTSCLLLGSLTAQLLSKYDTSTDNPYVLAIDVKNDNHDKGLLSVFIKLDEGSWFVSPYSKDDYKGYWRVELEENDFISMAEDFEEIPRAKADNDPFRNELAFFVKENTIYEYQLHRRTARDFTVTGKVVFVIEPKCTLENRKFELRQSAGRLTAKMLD